MEDYYCLEDESFLNDVIIDFYFKWIQHKILKETTFKDNMHVFTTYFYKRYANLVQKYEFDFLTVISFIFFIHQQSSVFDDFSSNEVLLY